MAIFGNLFDFNGDGKVDFFEEVMELEFIDSLGRPKNNDDDDCDDDDF